MEKHFPVGNPWRKYINNHTLKISYSCTRNMAVHISSHNKRVIASSSNKTDDGCNCQSEKTKLKRLRTALEIPENQTWQPPDWFIGSCPLDKKCKTDSLVYKATVTSKKSGNMDYYGLTANTFKERYNSHCTSFRCLSKPESSDKSKEVKKTTLTSHIQSLEEKGEKYSMKWQIQRRAFSYRPGCNFCSLCLTEKTQILLADPKKTLNRRTELLEKCRHKAKFKLNS